MSMHPSKAVMRYALPILALWALPLCNAAFRNQWKSFPEINDPAPRAYTDQQYQQQQHLHHQYQHHSAFGEIDLPLGGDHDDITTSLFHPQTIDTNMYRQYGHTHQAQQQQQEIQHTPQLPFSYPSHDADGYVASPELVGYEDYADLSHLYHSMSLDGMLDGSQSELQYATNAQQDVMPAMTSSHGITHHSQGQERWLEHPADALLNLDDYETSPLQDVTDREATTEQEADVMKQPSLEGGSILPHFNVDTNASAEEANGSGSSSRRKGKGKSIDDGEEGAKKPSKRPRGRPRINEVDKEGLGNSQRAIIYRRRQAFHMWLTEQWASRKMTYDLPAQELAARVTEIKIDFPEKLSYTGHLSGDWVEQNSDIDDSYKIDYHRWCLTYYNKMSNLTRTLRKQNPSYTPDDLRRVLREKFRQVDPKHAATRADPRAEENSIAYSHGVWNTFMEQRLQPALDAGEVFSMPLVAKLAHEFSLPHLHHLNTLRYIKKYLLSVMGLPPQDLEELSQCIQIEKGLTVDAAKKPPRGRRL